jgi:hypothetical protein
VGAVGDALKRIEAEDQRVTPQVSVGGALSRIDSEDHQVQSGGAVSSPGSIEGAEHSHAAALLA